MPLDLEPVLTLQHERLEVDPGGEVRTTVTIRNPSDIVEDYVIDVVGPATEWARVEPRASNDDAAGRGRATHLRLMTGVTVECDVVFAPPTGSGTPAGEIPFGVRCRSENFADRTNVVEGDVSVAPMESIEAQLSPTLTHGRLRGNYRVELENRGSVPERVSLDAADDQNALAFAIAPATLDVPAGRPGEALLRVTPHRPMLRGKPVQHQFKVTGTYGNPPRALTPIVGTYEQRPYISKRAMLVVGLAVAIAIAMVALSLMKKKPAEAVIAPAMPDLQAVTGTQPGEIELSWEPQPGVDAFKVIPVASDSEKTGKPISVDGQQTTYTAKTTRRQCYRLVAIAGKAQSDASDRQCADAARATKLAPPTNLDVQPADDPLSAALTWTSSDPSAETIVLIDGQPHGEPIFPNVSKTKITVTSPGTVEIRLVSMIGKQKSDLSDPVNFTFGAATSTTSTTAGSGAAALPATADEVRGAYAVIKGFDSSNADWQAQTAALQAVDPMLRVVPGNTPGLAKFVDDFWLLIRDQLPDVASYCAEELNKFKQVDSEAGCTAPEGT